MIVSHERHWGSQQSAVGSRQLAVGNQISWLLVSGLTFILKPLATNSPIKNE
jgi:hypothetical protein